MSPPKPSMAARSAGIQISVDGDDLVLESAAEPPVAVVDLLTQHKAGILTLLRSGIGSAPIIASSSADNIGSASSDIAGSAASEIIGSAPIIAAADITALRRSPGDEWSTKDWRAYRDERAAIAEFDGGLPRPQAEGRAYKACLAEWLDQHPVSSKVDDGCRVCGATDRPNDPLLPVGLGSGLERTWLHSQLHSYLAFGADGRGCRGPGRQWGSEAPRAARREGRRCRPVSVEWTTLATLLISMRRRPRPSTCCSVT